MTDAVTPVRAARLTLGRLLVAALAVAPLATVMASFVYAIAIRGDDPIAGILHGTLAASMLAFLFVLAALLILAVPATFILVRLGLTPLGRDVVLLTGALAVALVLNWNSPLTYEGLPWVLPTYVFAGAGFWILALRRIERR